VRPWLRRVPVAQKPTGRCGGQIPWCRRHIDRLCGTGSWVLRSTSLHGLGVRSGREHAFVTIFAPTSRGILGSGMMEVRRLLDNPVLRGCGVRQSIIHKTLAQLRVVPNLSDYEAERSRFSWSAARSELEDLPGGGLNIAHNAVHSARPGAATRPGRLPLPVRRERLGADLRRAGGGQQPVRQRPRRAWGGPK
jgi:hypothetical protein